MARKWRPKNFSELIGQEAVRKTLTNSLIQKRVHPVLLFTGPRGTGKTSTARIFAKTLRCQNKKDLIPCEKCEDCQTIQSGSSLDVMEIDGASNNGVDAVRDLRDTVNYLPSAGFYKIYIIDEVHMLSTSAFNALLKTLEEPPDHVVFIMATTAANKIPQTVLSRCQRLDFHLISPRSLKEQLEKICQGENISIEEEALWLIAKQARGSLRAGLSLLDQLINFCGDAITQDQIADVLGLTDPFLVFDILKAIVQGSEKYMLENIHAFAIKGGEPEILFQHLIENLRDLLILKVNPDNSPVLVHASETEIDSLKKLGKTASYEDLHLMFDMLLKAERDLAFCHDKHIALEMLLLRLSQAPRVEFIAPLNVSQVQSSKSEDESETEKSSLTDSTIQKSFSEQSTTSGIIKDKREITSLQKTSSLDYPASEGSVFKTDISEEQNAETFDSSQTSWNKEKAHHKEGHAPQEKKKPQALSFDQQEERSKQKVKDRSEKSKSPDFSEKQKDSLKTSPLSNRGEDEISKPSSVNNETSNIPNKKWFTFIDFIR
ncbi:MAG: DNA polymerase III subunit gamma/tau, partial [Bdellovibrionales bacterium]|nr:DNA polymerase III subunit gamma/tau [Bdellovibrionales bacterium]